MKKHCGFQMASDFEAAVLKLKRMVRIWVEFYFFNVLYL